MDENELKRCEKEIAQDCRKVRRFSFRGTIHEDDDVDDDDDDDDGNDNSDEWVRDLLWYAI